MEEREKACDVRLLRAGGSKGGDRLRLLTLSKKKDAHRQKLRRVVAEEKRRVNEDGNKSYAKLAAEMGCPSRPSPTLSTRTWLQFVQEEAQDDGPGGNVMMPPYFFEKGLKSQHGHLHRRHEERREALDGLVANGRPYVFQQDSAPAHKTSPNTGARTCDPLAPLTANPSTFLLGHDREQDQQARPTSLSTPSGAAIKNVVAKACGRFRTPPRDGRRC
ncbi:Uncharacterized protein FKW44_013250 [Caligus rogercresseyi]|uniref:Uncharacterized protein n=1 Tax=Caligus rogercresseyi TaxID=217165 RepID=A0A7T8HKN1_CALRO|nr:Uncharacterized protein FKW44_013250 [Caligus rogercresseyi]